jgi:hypothetical protein
MACHYQLHSCTNRIFSIFYWKRTFSIQNSLTIYGFSVEPRTNTKIKDKPWCKLGSRSEVLLRQLKIRTNNIQFTHGETFMILKKNPEIFDFFKTSDISSKFLNSLENSQKLLEIHKNF